MPKKKEIVVKAPFFRPPPERLPNWERLKLFEISGRASEYLSVLMIFVGSLLCLFSFNNVFAPTDLLLHQPFFINAIGFLGAVNFLSGLFLLARE